MKKSDPDTPKMIERRFLAVRCVDYPLNMDLATPHAYASTKNATLMGLLG